MQGSKWTQAEDAYLRKVYSTVKNSEIAKAISERYGTNRSARAIGLHARNLGLRKAEGYKHQVPRTFWTDERREWFVSYVPGHTESEISAEHERLFGTPLTEGQIGSGKYVFGVRSGTTGGRFQKGQKSWNKGKTWEEMGINEETQERMRRRCFKKGQVHDRPDGWIKPIGYERLSRDGYIEVKVRDSATDGVQPKVPGQFNCNYRMKHHVVYEQAHGPIPEGCNIVFANGDKTDFSPENLVAVPRRLWAQIVRHDMRYFDAESLSACMKLAELKICISKAEKAPRSCKKCGEEFAPRYAHQRTCDTCLGRQEGRANDRA